LENPDTGAKNVEELLKKACEQRGSLDGDDREFFLAQGADPASMLPSHRYIKVYAEGMLKVKQAGELPLETRIKVMRIKPGEPCSLVMDIESEDDLPESQFGTIVIGRAVVALRTDFHSCTVSFANPIEGTSCCDIVRSVWPQKDEEGKFLAGGHADIAGGPRSLYCGIDALAKLRDATLVAIEGK
jgi:hypothetical protein